MRAAWTGAVAVAASELVVLLLDVHGGIMSSGWREFHWLAGGAE